MLSLLTCHPVDWESFFSILLELKHPTATSRTDALYVSLEGKKIQRPEDVVTESDAKGIIQTVESALATIASNEIMGYQIGTKGFM